MIARALALLATLSVALALHAAPNDDINEGKLQFLTHPPAQAPYEHTKRILITAASLESGWIKSEQCHRNMDEVPALQVVFKPGTVRKLRILRAEHIKKAWIEHDSVQVEDIGPHAVLCLSSENRTLNHDAAEHTYLLASGPYMRRFLDGYFPMHVELTVDYPPQLLAFEGVVPTTLRHHAVIKPGHLKFDVLFDGRLLVGMQFADLRAARPTVAPIKPLALSQTKGGR